MKRTQKLVLLSRLSKELKDRGSWAGEMHLQKAVYLLQEIRNVPLGYPFVLYHYGPFSFELREELNKMRADGLLELVPRPYPYGPSFSVTEAAQDLEQRFPKTLSRVQQDIEVIASRIGSRSASILERLATALYLLKVSPQTEISDLAVQLNRMKPHISVEAAREALEEMKQAMEDEGVPSV